MSTSRDPVYRRHRFPPEVISYAVWLYFRFPLSLRMVEEMLAERGICVTYETVRQWGKKFGERSPIRSASARLLAATNGIWMRSSSRSPASNTGFGARSIRMVSFSTSWSSVEETLALRSGSMRKLLDPVAPPRVMITDKLRSYGAARAKMGLRVDHRQHKGLNNRAGEFPPADTATRTDHEAIQVSRQAQRFLSVHDQVANLFHVPYPDSATADVRRASRDRAFTVWRDISKTGAAV